MSKKCSYTLGLDIGIGSVGWGLIDQEQNIVDAGVRLFPEADVSNNDGRRTKRGSRRLLRRRQHRINRVKNLLENHGFLEKEINYSSAESPYYVRTKGLYQKLTKNELCIALLHLAKRRGIHNVEAAEKEDAEENSLSTKDQIAKNEELLKNKFVCEVQLDWLEQNGQIRGHKNRFKTSDYEREAQQILDTQSKYYDEINQDFIEDFIEILVDRREYFEGPGLGSPYGWEQNTHKWYEKMMGKCTYYPEELRAVKEAYSAQLFNLLNDLNNLSINRPDNYKLSMDEKEKIINNLFKDIKNVKIKRIAKLLGVSESDIKGFRMDKNQTPIFTSLTVYHDIKKITTKDTILNSADALDTIAEILTIYQDSNHKIQALRDANLPLNEEEIVEICQLNYTQTHSLSLKLIKQLLPDLWETNENQMQLMTKYGIKPKKIKLNERVYIPYSHIDDWILSPVVKRAFKQSIRIVNAIIKKYGYPQEIVIELARERNSQDRKKFLDNIQRKNEALNREIKEKLSAKGLEKSKGIFNKLRLWHLQDGICLYSLKPIKIDDLLDNHLNYEIDHILPKSVAFDDSLNNKVLVYKDENQKKGNRTPFQYLNSNESNMPYEKFKSHILQLSKSKDKLPKKKLQYLLEERDINKFEVQKEFINRNLVDTRYATRELLNLLQSFVKENDLNTKVKSINGSFTNYLRKLWGFEKDRGVDYKHHAEDALIVAMASKIFENNQELSKQNKLLTSGKVVDTNTGEILSEEQWNELMTQKMKKVKEIKEYPDYKYSHKVDMKPNRQLMNDTIYSTRERDGQHVIIEKIKERDLYNKDSDKLKKILNKTPENLLMYHHDRMTFKLLKEIFDRYQDVKNPLFKYYQDEGTYFRKYSKKGNGPFIKSIKYYGKKLNEHKDISHKFDVKPDKKVINLSLKPFRMDVFFEEDTYKFITIRYNDLKEQEDGYYLDKELYNKKLKEKKIRDINRFQFSLYKNDICLIDDEVYRLIGVNNDQVNKIELNKVQFDYKEYCKRKEIKNNRIMKVISKNTKKCTKIHHDVLGNEYKSLENPKFFYKK